MGPLLSEDVGPRDEPLLRELIREAERALDYQVRAFERADSRAEQMIGLSTGALIAGWAAVTTLTSGPRAPPPAVFLAMVAAGSASILISIAVFVSAYLGLHEHSAVRIGPTPEWLVAEARETTLVLGEHHRRALKVHADNFAENLVGVFEAGRARGRGVPWLIVGVLLFGAAFHYVGGW